MFENLPEKIKKLYQDKIKEEELKQKGNESTDNNMSNKNNINIVYVSFYKSLNWTLFF